MFGPTSKFFGDNGKFNNDDFNDMCESLNIIVKKTAAESPFSNGLCERHNAVLEDMLLKVTCNKSISLDISFAGVNKCKEFTIQCSWIFALSVGIWKKKQIYLVYLINNKLPALEEIPSTEIISANLKAMQEARKAIVHSESPEKLKRTLWHNTRRCNNLKLLCRDSVCYKRNNN